MRQPISRNYADAKLIQFFSDIWGEQIFSMTTRI